MALLNYTTKLPAEQTIAQISQMLSKGGATAIMTEYAEGQITGLSFRIRMTEQDVTFKLPADWRPVQKVLENQKVEPRYRTDEQAIKVSWKILHDWVKAQMALIEVEMVSLDQVFLPYAVMKDGKTLYEQIVSGQHQLEAGGKK